MAVIDQAVASASATCNLQAAIVDGLRARLAAEFWRWFREHREDIVVSQRVLFLTLRFRVRDLKSLFEALFGEDPLAPLLQDFDV